MVAAVVLEFSVMRCQPLRRALGILSRPMEVCLDGRFLFKWLINLLLEH
ncbi:acetyltransferase [Vibrio cholerae]|nr:acetyltransferase [Vibrio cholerae]TXZ65837.1 acetyltransferase [Vibrio cholerae]